MSLNTPTIKPLDFNNLRYDKEIASEILKIDNCCGVLTCYFLSVIFDFKFDIEEFRNIGEGLTNNLIEAYARRNGVCSISRESSGIEQGGTCIFSYFDVLCQNGIVMTLSGLNTNHGNPHVSIICEYDNKGGFTQLCCDPENCVEHLDKVEGLYLVFYYKDGVNISKHVEFTPNSNRK